MFISAAYLFHLNLILHSIAVFTTNQRHLIIAAVHPPPTPNLQFQPYHKTSILASITPLNTLLNESLCGSASSKRHEWGREINRGRERERERYFWANKRAEIEDSRQTRVRDSIRRWRRDTRRAPRGIRGGGETTASKNLPSHTWERGEGEKMGVRVSGWSNRIVGKGVLK